MSKDSQLAVAFSLFLSLSFFFFFCSQMTLIGEFVGIDNDLSGLHCKSRSSSFSIPLSTFPTIILSKMQYAAAAAAKSLQSCPTLCNPIDGSPPDSPVHGILQARTVEWVAISFSNA